MPICVDFWFVRLDKFRQILMMLFERQTVLVDLYPAEKVIRTDAIEKTKVIPEKRITTVNLS